MTQYMLSVYGADPDESVTPEEMEKIHADVGRVNEKLQSEGAWVFAGGLHPIEATTTVDATGDETLVVDGPYAESKEYLGGFWIIEAADLDAALAWAKEGSAACRGKIEVRPFDAAPA